jgi:lysozyme family protein
MMNIVTLKAANAKRWANAKLTRSFNSVARHLVDPGAKARYLTVSAKTGVPWAFIAVAHERACSQDWTGIYYGGSSTIWRSSHVPRALIIGDQAVN